jgi:hypothetical protein
MSPLTLTHPALEPEPEEDYCNSGSEWESGDSDSSDSNPTRMNPVTLHLTHHTTILPLRPARRPRSVSNPIATLLAPHLAPTPVEPIFTPPNPDGTARPPKLRRQVSFKPMHETRTYTPNAKVHIFSDSTHAPTYTANPTGPISLARDLSSPDKQILILGWSPLDSDSDSDSNDSEVSPREIQKARSSRRPCICVQRYCARLQRLNPDGDVEVDLFGGLEHTSLQERHDGCLETMKRLHSRFVAEIESQSKSSSSSAAPPAMSAADADSVANKALSVASAYITHTRTRLNDYMNKIDAYNEDKPARMASCPDDYDVEAFEGFVDMVRDRLEELMLDPAGPERDVDEDIEKVLERLRGSRW